MPTWTIPAAGHSCKDRGQSWRPALLSLLEIFADDVNERYQRVRWVPIPRNRDRHEAWPPVWNDRGPRA